MADFLGLVALACACGFAWRAGATVWEACMSSLGRKLQADSDKRGRDARRPIQESKARCGGQRGTPTTERPPPPPKPQGPPCEEVRKGGGRR